MDSRRRASCGAAEMMRAVEATGDESLQARAKNAMNVIERTLALYKIDEVACAFSGGKDSTVLLHLLRAGYGALEPPAGSEGRRSHAPRIRAVYFKHPQSFPELDQHVSETAKLYNVDLEIVRLDFKAGMEAVQREKPVKAVFLGTRMRDPDTKDVGEFAPSSSGWAPFMRVNPILDWTYRDVWAFLRLCKIPYCRLYDQGFTSIGKRHDTGPNPALRLLAGGKSADKYKPAYVLLDEALERAGRLKGEEKEREKARVEKGENERVWCSAGVSCLLDLYEDVWVPMGRRNLKSRQWEEIAAELGKRCSQQMHRTGPQCKNKVEKMKKHFRSERAAEGDKPGAPSRWHWYARMEHLMTGDPSAAAARCASSSPDKETLFEEARRPSPSPPPPAPGAQSPALADVDDEDEGGSFSSLPPSGAEPWTSRSKEDNAGANPRKRRMHDPPEAAARPPPLPLTLAESVQSLGDGLLRIERMRTEMELKSREMFLQTQLQLASLFAKSLDEKKRRPTKQANSSSST